MKWRFSLFAVIAFTLAQGNLFQMQGASTDDSQTARSSPIHDASFSGHIVMTWAPAYGIEKAKARLDESFGGNGLQSTITHLALQFWIPTAAGGVETTAKYGAISDETITFFRQWGHAHGIRVMLCVFNGLETWDWSLARSAFADHPKEFADALVAEVERRHLDGVDIDLEGQGSLDDDKAAFVQFMRGLSEQLHARGKHLTVDSFASRWNAPNQTWWQDLLPLVDGLTSMGYADIGRDGEDWHGYASQKAAAGAGAAKLLLGVPSEKDEWQAHPAVDQIDWIAADGGVGAAIWDAQLDAPAWRQSDIWAKIRKISGRK
jgi:Glycosyl hydrolases family 18